MNNAYKRVLEIVTDNPDYKAIALKLAQEDPELFVKLVDGEVRLFSWFPYRVTSDMIMQVKGVYAGSGKVPAIRLLREMTGCGLKEAKDYIEKVL